MNTAVLVVVLVVAVLVFLVLREVWCWYWKLTAILEELQAISAYLKAAHEREVKRDARGAPSVFASGGER